MKKAFGQTVRDIKRGVNKKVLKVPGIEQKVLDSTSNESWGPHGSLLADIAEASRNYHDYQMIMGIIWKRLSDTGKNWRHVYKGLTVLEYLVAHGSERVIDEIRERAYQISTLSDFQYIDSSGRDQGSNVRKKSQSLVALVNDKETIIEVRQKAAVNREKFRRPAAGGMHRPGSNSDTEGYGDKYDYEGRSRGRDEDRNGRERDYEYGDADRYSRDGDRNSRDSEDRYGRDGYRDDDSRGRSRSVDAYQHGSRGRSADRDRTFDDDGQTSSRGSNARADDPVQDARGLERKFPEQNIGDPPSYEEAASKSRSPVYSERDGGETSQVSAPGASPPAANNPNNGTDSFTSESSPAQQEAVAFDEFDPRGAVSAGHPTPKPAVVASATNPVVAASAFTSVPPPASATSNTVEMDLLGSLTDTFAPDPLAIIPAGSASAESDAQVNFGPLPSNSASQTFDDPFGDGPFKAVSSTDCNQIPLQISAVPFNSISLNQSAEVTKPTAQKTDPADNFGFGDTFNANLYHVDSVFDERHTSNPQFWPQEQSIASLQDDFDILAGILPPSGPPDSLPSLPNVPIPTSEVAIYQPSQTPTMPSQTPYGLPSQMPFGQPGFGQLGQAPFGQPGQTPFGQPGQTPFGQPGETPFGQSGQPFNMSQSQNITGVVPYGNGGFMQQQGSVSMVNAQIPQYTPGMASQSFSSGNFLSLNAPTSQIHQYSPYGPPPQHAAGNFLQQQTSAVSVASYIPTQQAPAMPVPRQNNSIVGNLCSPTVPSTSVLTGSLTTVPQTSKDKFETKSTVWADTLSRGLVNLNISGPKTNPLADIGVDFDAINRRDKRMEKPMATPVTSTVTMGKAMGSGTGMGRAGVGTLRPPPNPMAGSGVPMGGGYGGTNQQPLGMGMNVNMGMGQGYPMQQPQQPNMNPGSAMPGSAMPGGYNSMMGSSGYNPQQPYGGYR